MWKASFCIFVLLGAVSLLSCGSSVDTPSATCSASDLPGDWSKHKPVDDGFDGPCDGEYINVGKFVGGDIKEVAYEQKDIGPFFSQYLISFEKESEAKSEFDRIIYLWEKCASQVYWDDPVSPRSIHREQKRFQRMKYMVSKTSLAVLPEIMPEPPVIADRITGAVITTPSKITANFFPTFSEVAFPNF